MMGRRDVSIILMAKLGETHFINCGLDVGMAKTAWASTGWEGETRVEIVPRDEVIQFDLSGTRP